MFTPNETPRLICPVDSEFKNLRSRISSEDALSTEVKSESELELESEQRKSRVEQERGSELEKEEEKEMERAAWKRVLRTVGTLCESEDESRRSDSML